MSLHTIGNENRVSPHLKWNINIQTAMINIDHAVCEGDVYMIAQNWATYDRLGEKRILVLRFRQRAEEKGGGVRLASQ